MIKLIATDIDGTLVKDGTLIIDPEYMTVISKLIDKGINSLRLIRLITPIANARLMLITSLTLSFLK